MSPVIIYSYFYFLYYFLVFKYLFFSCLGDHKKSTIGKLVAEIIAPFLGPRSKVHSGVTDGGEITSVKFTAQNLPTQKQYMKRIQERLCLCHRLNNAIKDILKAYFETPYLITWRAFISRINYSNPFNELFEECKKKQLGENCVTRLQKDCETRYFFKISI